MPRSRLLADESGLPDDPQLERTDLRHGVLRAMASTAEGDSLYMAMDGFIGEGDFAAAVTEPFGDRLNLFGAALLQLWDREFGPPVL